MKNVIHIFGASGSGTTTLARKIAAELGYRMMDTDDYFWLPTAEKYTEKRPVEERLALMNRDIDSADNVVISGSLTGWGDVLIPRFTLVVRIVMDPDLRIERLKQREKERYGARIEPDGDRYQAYQAFVEWARSYETGGLGMRSMATHDAWEKLRACDVLHLDGAEPLEEKFKKVTEALERQKNG